MRWSYDSWVPIRDFISEIPVTGIQFRETHGSPMDSCPLDQTDEILVISIPRLLHSTSWISTSDQQDLEFGIQVWKLQILNKSQISNCQRVVLIVAWSHRRWIAIHTVSSQIKMMTAGSLESFWSGFASSIGCYHLNSTEQHPKWGHLTTKWLGQFFSSECLGRIPTVCLVIGWYWIGTRL